MEATVERQPLYESVGFGGAVARQFRLLWGSRRPLVLLLGLVAALALAGEPWSDPILTRLLFVAPFLLVLVGPLWAFTVYHGEGPSNRLYHWSQPVRRDLHTLARIAAGAAWLMILFGVLALVGLAVAAMDGAAAQLGQVGFSGWVNFFTAPLIGYLAVSVLTVLSDYPIRWFFGLISLFFIVLLVIQEAFGWSRAIDYILAPLGGETWALGPTLVVPFVAAREQVEAALAGQNGSAGLLPEGFLSTWWVAMPLWILLFCGIIWFLARRHPDVLPRWHR